MNLIRYWCRKGLAAFYLAAAAVFALLFVWQARAGIPLFLRMLCIFWLLLLTVRTEDDISDYETDRGRKKQYLKRPQLIVMFCALSAVFLILHILWFGSAGMLCLAAVLYIPLMNRLPVAKILFSVLVFTIYLLLNRTDFGILQLTICIAFLLLSAGYAVWKRKSE